MCNILPKKNWHVLKKENIDRVRRDEAIAAEEEKARLRKIAIAEKEARTELLRDKARTQRLSRDAVEAGTSSSPALPISFTSAGVVAEPKGGLTHVNFFKESEAGNAEEKANQERKKEEKEEQEKWERKVGISVALGQVPGGPLDNQLNPWWMQAKKEKEEEDEEERDKRDTKKKKDPEKKPPMSYKEKFDADRIKAEGRHKRDERRKRQMDPMMEVEKQMSKHKKHKKDKQHYGDDHGRSTSARKEKKEKVEKKKKTIEELRAERLKREGKERTKALDFLGGKPGKKEKEELKEKDRDADKNYFNSQFFPELARKRKA